MKNLWKVIKKLKIVRKSINLTMLFIKNDKIKNEGEHNMTSLFRLLIVFIFLYAQSSFATIVDSDEEIPNIDTHTYIVDYIGPEDNPDEFVIADHHFYPKTYCDVAAGDKIKFLVNTPDDCVDAKLYNYRTQRTCDVWCNT